MINAAATNRLPGELTVLAPIATPATPSTVLQTNGTLKQMISHRVRSVRDRNHPFAFKFSMALTPELTRAAPVTPSMKQKRGRGVE